MVAVSTTVFVVATVDIEGSLLWVSDMVIVSGRICEKTGLKTVSGRI